MYTTRDIDRELALNGSTTYCAHTLLHRVPCRCLELLWTDTINLCTTHRCYSLSWLMSLYTWPGSLQTDQETVTPTHTHTHTHHHHSLVLFLCRSSEASCFPPQGRIWFHKDTPHTPAPRSCHSHTTSRPTLTSSVCLSSFTQNLALSKLEASVRSAHMGYSQRVQGQRAEKEGTGSKVTHQSRQWQLWLLYSISCSLTHNALTQPCPNRVCVCGAEPSRCTTYTILTQIPRVTDSP